MCERIVRVVKLGRISYDRGLELQRRCVAKHLDEREQRGRNINSASGSSDTLLLLEHTPVYTVGMRRQQYPEEALSRLRDVGAEVRRTDRGGLVTFHGPGQLVAYPILDLKHFPVRGVRGYVCALERCVVSVCRHFNIAASTSPHTGVWVGDRKIAAVGIHVTRYITSHGIAINCSTELAWFRHIVPCGLVGKGVTSLSEELGRRVGTAEVLPALLASFTQHFACQLVEGAGGDDCWPT